MKRHAWIAAIALLAYLGVRNWERSATMARPKEPPAPGALPPPHDQRGTGPPQRAPSAAPATGDHEGGIAARPRPVISGPMVEQRIEYYDVSGTSARELTLAMKRLGPKGAGGHAPWVSSVAATGWDVRWRADYWSGEGSCAIKSFSTRVDIHIVLPKWPGRAAGHPLADRWDSFTQAVSLHEQGHAEHGILAAKAIQERVSALAPAGSCQELENSIRSTARMLIDRHREEDIEYDWRRTRDAVFDDEETDWLYGLVPRPINPPAVADAEMTDTDRQRQAGTMQFEADMAGLSARADEEDAAWRAYREGCHLTVGDHGAAAAVGSRAWFVYAWGGEAARGAITCAEAGAFYALADLIKDGMCAAEEKARRSSVYPGTRRELRTRYRLEWDGWDRVCP